MKFFTFGSKDIGIDLGTANVLIYIKGQGIVLNEPSIVAIDTDSKKVIAVGREANEMLGRTPGKVKAIKPMKDGVIADFEITEIMLNTFIKKIKASSLFSRPRILICCPTNVTPVEKNAIKEAIKNIRADTKSFTDTGELNGEEEQAEGIIPADPDVKNFTYTFAGGKLYYRKDSKMYLQDIGEKQMERIKGLDKIRRCTRHLI